MKISSCNFSVKQIRLCLFLVSIGTIVVVVLNAPPTRPPCDLNLLSDALDPSSCFNPPSPLLYFPLNYNFFKNFMRNDCALLVVD